jgi:hypothetical protein
MELKQHFISLYVNRLSPHKHKICTVLFKLCQNCRGIYNRLQLDLSFLPSVLYLEVHSVTLRSSTWRMSPGLSQPESYANNLRTIMCKTVPSLLVYDLRALCLCKESAFRIAQLSLFHASVSARLCFSYLLVRFTVVAEKLPILKGAVGSRY